MKINNEHRSTAEVRAILTDYKFVSAFGDIEPGRVARSSRSLIIDVVGNDVTGVGHRSYEDIIVYCDRCSLYRAIHSGVPKKRSCVGVECSDGAARHGHNLMGTVRAATAKACACGLLEPPCHTCLEGDEAEV